MFPPFPQEMAHHYCQKLISALDSGDVILKQTAKISQERQNQGIMLGCLVCKKKTDNSDFVVLYAFSGRRFEFINQNWKENRLENVIFVPSIVSENQIDAVLEKNDKKIHQLTEKINGLEASEERSELIAERTTLTDESLKAVFKLYEFTCFNGEKISLNQIIKEHSFGLFGGRTNQLPPTGTGDCCAPKLLSYAFANNLQPISMDEVFYGNSTKNKISGKSYEPCDERCGYILPWILGLEIIYRDDDIVVVNKQSGLLSVPGRTEDKKDCVEARLRNLFPDCIVQPAVHRLDMETSGLLILALNKEAHRKLNQDFAEGKVSKKYEALLDGCLDKASGLNAPKNGESQGKMELKFRLDVDNRPHQIYDEESGKNGITEWEKKEVCTWKNPVNGQKKVVTKVLFTPHTGRTHQLRLASSDFHGFGMPILGDTLYGNCSEGERLMLHACEITFNHPVTGEEMHFELPAKFF